MPGADAARAPNPPQTTLPYPPCGVTSASPHEHAIAVSRYVDLSITAERRLRVGVPIRVRAWGSECGIRHRSWRVAEIHHHDDGVLSTRATERVYPVAAVRREMRLHAAPRTVPH